MREREQFEVAAQWWADRLVDCKHSGLSAEERRDPSSRSYELAEMLMTLTRPFATEEQVSAFKSALIAGLEGAGEYERRCLGVDYHPDRLLADALAVAGIRDDMGTLPIKTTMWLSEDGSVRVRYGYGAEIQELRSAQQADVKRAATA